MNVKVKKGVIDSDHHLSLIKVKFQPNRSKPKLTKNLRVDPEFLKQNASTFQESIPTHDSSDWLELKDILSKASQNIGTPPRKRKHRWWNETCDKAINFRIKAWQNWNSHKTEQNWQEFTKVQKQTSKIIRSEKRKYDHYRLAEIEQDFTKNNTRNFYKTFREELSNYQAPSLCFKRPDGTLETNNQ